MQINKSDRNDALGIARIMQCGWYKEVRVKDLGSHAIKAVLISRALLVKIKRDLENQIRGLLKNLRLLPAGESPRKTLAKNDPVLLSQSTLREMGHKAEPVSDVAEKHQLDEI